MTKNNFTGAVAILGPEANTSEVAESIASVYFPGSEYHFRVSETLPDTLSDELTSQLESKMKQGSIVLTVYPTAEGVIH